MKFRITVTQTAILELDQRVIDAVDDEWRNTFYHLEDATDIARMIGRCMLLYGSKLSHLDGWADLPDEYAELSCIDDESDAEPY